jgi:hypothetical protein
MGQYSNFDGLEKVPKLSGTFAKGEMALLPIENNIFCIAFG